MRLVDSPYEVDFMRPPVGPVETKINGQITEPPCPERFPGQSCESEVVPYETVHQYLDATNLDSQTFLENTLADGTNGFVELDGAPTLQ